MTFGQRPSDDERVLAILEQARSAPLPAAPEGRLDPVREERRREQIRRLAQCIQRVPALLHGRRTLRRRAGVAALAVVAAAAAVLVFVRPGGEVPKLTQSAPPVRIAEAADAPAPGLLIRQVVGKVIATHENGSDIVLSAQMSLDQGDTISTTAEAYASLELEAGTRVDLASATTLESVRARELVLRVGRVDVNVPRIPGVAPRLVIETPSARVVVRGTIFSVEVQGVGPTSETKVGVTRGSVAVFHGGQEHLVMAGQFWSSDAPAEMSSLLESESVPNAVGEAAKNASPWARVQAPRRRAKSEPVVVEPPARPEAAQRSEAAQRPEAAQSSLSQQNRLFARGLRARDEGDDRRAAYWFDQLLRRYPASPLAESAERERSAARGRLQAN